MTKDEYYEKRGKTARMQSDLKKCIPHFGKLLLTLLTDVSIITFLIALYVYQSIVIPKSIEFLNILGLGFVMLLILGFYAIFIINVKVSPGQLIFGLKYTMMKDGSDVTKSVMFEYFATNLGSSIAYTDIGMLSRYNSRTKQDLAMQKLGIIVVVRRKYNKWKKEYEDFEPVFASFDESEYTQKLKNIKPMKFK